MVYRCVPQVLVLISVFIKMFLYNLLLMLQSNSKIFICLYA